MRRRLLRFRGRQLRDRVKTLQVKLECEAVTQMPVLSKIANAVSFAKALLDIKMLNGKESASELVHFAMRSSFIRPYQIEEEFKQFAALVAERRARFIMEIGTLKGGTLFTFSRLATSDAKIIYLDLTPHSRLRGALYRTFTTDGGKVVPIIADSHQQASLDKVKSELQGGALDILFIDGDHSYDGVRRDFEMYSPLVRLGGMVAFHDIAEHPPEAGCEVSRLWQELKQHHQHVEIVKDPGQNWAGIGVLYV